MVNGFLFISTVSVIFFLLVGGIFIRKCFVVITVENVSMYPTLKHGDRVLVTRYWATKWLSKGQIVLVWPWRISSRPTLFEVKPYIKRIIALEGETLITTPKDEVEADYGDKYDAEDYPSYQIWHIPQGYIFVRGDNRSSSLDSLAWGPIPLKSILGVVLMKLPSNVPFPPLSEPLAQSFVNNKLLLPGQQAPPFIAQTLEGETVTRDTYKGQPAVFLFVAPSELCRNAIHRYLSLVPGARGAGVTIVFVSSVGLEATRNFVDELNIRQPILLAPRAHNPFFHNYGVFGTPFYCFVNAQGNIQSIGYPNFERGEWKTLIESWLQQEITEQ